MQAKVRRVVLVAFASATIVGSTATFVGCLPDSKPTTALPPKTTVGDVAPANETPVSTTVADPLRQRIESAIHLVVHRDVLTTNSFWTIFHGILGVGPGLTLKDPETGKKYRALDYLLGETGRNVRGLMFEPTDVGLDVISVGKNPFAKEHEGQGHQDQFLAEMIQWSVPPSQEIVLHGKKYTFRDLIAECKARVRLDADQELSWAIIVIGQDGGGVQARWKNRFGRPLHYEDVVKYELEADVLNAACGGTHRLFGLTWAHHLHRNHCLATRTPPSPLWVRVEKHLDDYKNKSRQWQNPDGSFSVNHYRGPGFDRDLESRLSTSGHILEWLAQYVSDEEIASEWMKNGARAVAEIILETQNVPAASGSLYHAAHGLITYHRRLYKTPIDFAPRAN
jgi:hypothetical protein